MVPVFTSLVTAIALLTFGALSLPFVPTALAADTKEGTAHLVDWMGGPLVKIRLPER
jgi:hypothetical protein